MEKRSTIEWLCANEKCSFSTTPEEWRRELAPGMYVWTDNSTVTKINILHGMFEECNNLIKIQVGEQWSTDVVTRGENMFNNCTALSGAIAYDASKTDATYANYTTGYLTLKK